MVSFLLVRVRPGSWWLSMVACGLTIGFLLPAIASVLSYVMPASGGRDIGLRLTREKNGLQLRLESDFSPKHQRNME